MGLCGCNNRDASPSMGRGKKVIKGKEKRRKRNVM